MDPRSEQNSDQPEQSPAGTEPQPSTWGAPAGVPPRASAYGQAGSQGDAQSGGYPPAGGSGQPGEYGQSAQYRQPGEYGQPGPESSGQPSGYGQPSGQPGPQPSPQAPAYGIPVSVNGAGAQGGNTGPLRTKRSVFRTLLTVLAVLIGLSLALALTGLGLYFSTSSTSAHKREIANQPQSTTTAPLAGRASSAPDWEAVSEAVRPATVSIQVRVGNGGDSGSGVLWDNAGHVVTNYHVVADANGADTVTVILNDGRLYHAEVVGSDPTTDLAVLKLQGAPNDLVAANFGSSAELKVGQAVMAIGSPLGLDDTVTTGIISALDRPVAVKTAVPRGDSSGIAPELPFGGQAQNEPEPVITNAIQVDASINPGNSGGPLFDDSGRVIGINSSIASMGRAEDSAGSIGLGFAIPVDLVKNVATQLIEKGQVAHGQLGVRVGTAPVKVGSESRLGVQVGSVNSGSGAAQAGLREGDFIIKIDGKDVRSARSLIGYVRRYLAGETVTLTIVRDGTTQEVPVQLGSLEPGA